MYKLCGLDLYFIDYAKFILNPNKWLLFNKNNLDSLTVLIISFAPIDYIPNNAFEFRQESKEEINVYLDNNHKLNGSGFDINAFQNMRRPADIHFYSATPGDDLEFLDEKVFSVFLSTNERN